MLMFLMFAKTRHMEEPNFYYFEILLPNMTYTKGYERTRDINGLFLSQKI